MPVAIGVQHATLNWEDPSCHCGPARHTEHRGSQLIEENDEGEEGEEEEEGGEETDIKSNNPHLTGGEIDGRFMHCLMDGFLQVDCFLFSFKWFNYEGRCIGLKVYVCPLRTYFFTQESRCRKSAFENIPVFWCFCGVFFPVLFITWMTSQVLNLRSLLILSHRHFPLLFTEFYRSSEFGTVSRYDSSESSEDTFPSCVDTVEIRILWGSLTKHGMYLYKKVSTLSEEPELPL